jgi:ATP-dependent DNA helicase RecQ
MEFLARALDDPAPARCGRCMNCAGQTDRRAVPDALLQGAADFLRSDTLVLEPRAHWPKPVLAEVEKALPGAIGRFETGRPKVIIPETLRAQEGRTLCIYGDAGWGQEVAQGKYHNGTFSEALVNAAADLISCKWKPEPPPQWITVIPSQRHPQLVQEFAQRLAAKLTLPFIPALRQRNEAQPQKEMQNSAMQLRNILNAFQVAATISLPQDAADSPSRAPGLLQRWARQLAATLGSGPTLPSVPVLLVDDVVDSRWTLTVASVILRQHGSGPVYPFALAKASLRGS